jgi:hypothetical protein
MAQLCLRFTFKMGYATELKNSIRPIKTRSTDLRTVVDDVVVDDVVEPLPGLTADLPDQESPRLGKSKP